MRGRKRFRLIRVATIALVTCLAAFSSLFGPRRDGAVGHDAGLRTQGARAVAADRPRSEFRAEPLLKLDEFVGLGPEHFGRDPVLASLLKPRLALWPVDGAQEAGGRGREQLASLSPEPRGGAR